MKISQFTTILPYMDNNLLYNSYSDYYLLVKPILKELLEAARHENNIEGLQDYHPTFYKELLDNGFIVDQELDEVNEVRKLVKMIDGSNANYILTINPTMGCNFKCWYCYETHVQGSKMEQPIINRILKFMENEKIHNKHLQHFSLSFFGGEPLIYFDQAVVPLLAGATRIFKDSGISFAANFTTNGFLLNQKKIDFLKQHQVIHMQITLDGHRELHDQVRFVNADRGSYDQIISNIKLLLRNGIDVRMRINFTRDNFISCMDIADDFADLEDVFKERLTVDFHQVWQDDRMSTLSLAPAIDRFTSAGFNVSSEATGLNNVVGSCYADKNNSATINYNGEVFKCTARDFTTDNCLGTLENDGNIKWKPEYEIRQNAKFHNPPCLECKLLPICNGGCSQHAYEHLGSKDGYCVFGFDEHRKDEVILERFRLRTA